MGNQPVDNDADNTEISMESVEQRNWPGIEDIFPTPPLSNGKGSLYFYGCDWSPPKTKMSGPNQFLRKFLKWFPGKGRN